MTYWSGYYSTRPELKRKIKEQGELFDSMSHFIAQDNLNKFFKNKYLEHNSWFLSTGKVEESRQAFEKMSDYMAIAAHHDSITGTSDVKMIYYLLARLRNTTKIGDRVHSNLLARSLEVGDLDSNLVPSNWASVKKNFTMNKETYLMVQNPSN